MVALSMAQQQTDKWSGLVLVDTAAGGPGEQQAGFWAQATSEDKAAAAARRQTVGILLRIAACWMRKA